MFEAVQAPTTHCPLAPLALEAVRLIRMINFGPSDLFDPSQARLSDLEAAAGLLEARSQVGLLFQVCLAHTAVDDLKDGSLGDEGARQASDLAFRCLVAVARQLRVVGCEPLVEYYMGRAFDLETLAA